MIDIKSLHSGHSDEQVQVEASNHFVGMLEFIAKNSSSQKAMKILSERIRHLAVRLREIKKDNF